MYTNLNLVALGVYRWMPEVIRDIIRASTLFILVAVMTTWMMGDITVIYTELLESFGLHSIDPISYITMFAIDVILHVLPVLIIGVPQTSISYFIGYGCMMSWYAMIHKKSIQIYSKSVPIESSMIAVTIAAILGITG